MLEVHLMLRCVFTRLAVGELLCSGESTALSSRGRSSSRNGSVACDSGLLHPWFGAEKSELPYDEIDESEKVEQTDPDRSKAGLSLLLLSVIMAHSFAGLSTGELKLCWMRGAGVFGGVTRR